MRYSGYYNCKMCGKTWWHKSNWVPFELVDWIYSLLFLFHLIFHHFKELTCKNVAKGLCQVLRQFLCAILFLILIMIRIVFYPFYWFFNLFYWGTSVPLLFLPGIYYPGASQIFSNCIISHRIHQVKSFFWSNIYMPLGLHNKLTIISDSAICTKMLKNVINFCLFCELTFLKIYDIIFIEKIKKGYGDVYG